MYWPVLITLIAISLSIDWYFYLQFKHYLNKLYKKILYWIPGAFFTAIFISLRLSSSSDHQVTANEFLVTSWILWVYYLLYFPRIFFTIFDLINKLLCVIFKQKIRVFRYIAIALASALALMLVYGTVVTRTNFQVRTVEVANSKLPKAFDGFKIVQISDVHLGGWGQNYEAMDSVVALIMRQKPDMIVMTGDMVNNFASEFAGWKSHFCCLKAPYGVYAILGNHDYGDYSQWPSKEAKAKNLSDIKNNIRELGFSLMLDTNTVISKQKDSISLIGIENWGHPPFPRYGNLKNAMKGSESIPYKILLSHDPNHWEAEVLGKTDISLVLAGHTHGMQLGYDDGKRKFSPSQWIFKQWNGLYQTGEQFIYVNQGIGYVGAPFRIGIRPEISVIVLKKSN